MELPKVLRHTFRRAGADAPDFRMMGCLLSDSGTGVCPMVEGFSATVKTAMEFGIDYNK